MKIVGSLCKFVENVDFQWVANDYQENVRYCSKKCRLVLKGVIEIVGQWHGNDGEEVESEERVRHSPKPHYFRYDFLHCLVLEFDIDVHDVEAEFEVQAAQNQEANIEKSVVVRVVSLEGNTVDGQYGEHGTDQQDQGAKEQYADHHLGIERSELALTASQVLKINVCVYNARGQQNDVVDQLERVCPFSNHYF